MHIRSHLNDCHQAALTYFYHQRQNAEAKRALQNLYRADPNCKINDRQRRTINEYASEVFGSQRFSPWLYVYTAFRGQFFEGWMPDNFLGRALRSFTPGYSNLGAARTLTHALLQTTTLPDVLHFISGCFFTVDGAAVPDPARYLHDRGIEKIVVKMENSSQGRGIRVARVTDIDFASWAGQPNCVLQRFIEQAPYFERLSPKAVATLRLTTGMARGAASPRLCAAYLRVGTGSEDFIKTAQSLKIPIVDADGSLADFALDPQWRRLRRHPITGAALAPQKVPQFADATALVLALHRRLPHFLVLGWDLAFGKDDAIHLLEFNSHHPGIKFSEASTGPIFGGLNFEELATWPITRAPASGSPPFDK